MILNAPEGLGVIDSCEVLLSAGSQAVDVLDIKGITPYHIAACLITLKCRHCISGMALISTLECKVLCRHAAPYAADV